MRTFIYFIIGTSLGIAMVLGLWWALPHNLQADRAASQSQTRHAANVHETAQTLYESRQTAITKAVRDISPAVVGINVISIREYRTRNPFFDDPFFRNIFPDNVWREKVENLGSGFLISPDGYILTNEHVVHNATQVIVTMTDGQQFDADIVGFDYDSDVALLKINGKDFPFVEMGDSDRIIIGEWAIAIGNPFGLFSINSHPSVTVGVVSAIDRDFDRNQEGRLYQDMVQTDASINRGNSGGPLVNSLGQLIGMNTMIFTESGGSIGLSFAIPSNKLKSIYEDLLGRGSVERDYWIGLQIQNVNRLIAISLRLPEIRGVVVTDVEKGSPAAKAGIEAPDVILGIAGKRIDSYRDLQMYLRNSDLRVGDKLKMNIVRNGREKELTLKLGKRKG